MVVPHWKKTKQNHGNEDSISLSEVKRVRKGQGKKKICALQGSEET